MKYSFHPSAKNEFNEAIDYYDEVMAEPVSAVNSQGLATLALSTF